MAFTKSDATHTSSRRVRSPPEPDIRHRFVLKACAWKFLVDLVLVKRALDHKLDK